MSQRQVELNRGLARCSLASDVLALVGASVGEFNVVNCGTALGRLARAPDGRRALGDARVASPLDAAASLVARHARHVESRQLASILHACGKLGLRGGPPRVVVGRIEPRRSRRPRRRWVRVGPTLGVRGDAPARGRGRGASRIHADKFNAQEFDERGVGRRAARRATRPPPRPDPLRRHRAEPRRRRLRLGDDARPRAAAAAAWTPQGLSNAAWSLATMGAKLDALERANANANARAALVAVFAQLARRARELNPRRLPTPPGPSPRRARRRRTRTRTRRTI